MTLTNENARYKTQPAGYKMKTNCQKL